MGGSAMESTPVRARKAASWRVAKEGVDGRCWTASSYSDSSRTKSSLVLGSNARVSRSERSTVFVGTAEQGVGIPNQSEHWWTPTSMAH